MARKQKPIPKHRKVILGADERTDSELKTGRPTPYASFFALLIAALLVFAALGLLLAINHKPVWPGDGIYALVQPASILSLILSLISICVGFAYSDGVGYAWWRIQQNPSAEADDLQDAYAAGDGLFGALRYLFAWFWISLACLSLLLLTLNGFVLQGAISTRLYTDVNQAYIQVPTVRRLDLGFSSPPGLTLYDTNWIQVWQQVLNIDGISFTEYAYFGHNTTTGQAFNFGYDPASTYDAQIEGAGFEAACNSSTDIFDLTPSDEQDLTIGRIFSSVVTWDPDNPNDIRLNIVWKNTTDCAGMFQTKSCVFRAATVSYPLQVQMRVAGTSFSGPFYSLGRRPPGQPDPVVTILPPYEGEGWNNTYTYRGIAQSLAQTFNSSITATSSYDTSSPGDLTIEGQFAFNLAPKYPTGWQYQCNMSFTEGLRDLAYFQIIDSNQSNSLVERGESPQQSADPAEIIIQRLRQAMFLASIYSGSSAFGSALQFSTSSLNDSFQNVTAQQSTQIARYEVRLYLWGVSVAITFIVILCVLPLFWAFWRLTRHPGTTPVDYARAFRKSGTVIAGTSVQSNQNGDIEKRRMQDSSRSTSSRLRKK